jgi:hypothetical protein
MRSFLSRGVAALLLLPALALALSGFKTGSSSPYGPIVSPGLYYLGGTTIQPTAQQFATLVQQSGQTWTSLHPEAWMRAGLDFGVGTTQLVATLPDIAGFNSAINSATGDTWPEDTSCAYTASAGATWAGTGSAAPWSTNTNISELTLQSTTSGALAPAMFLQSTATATSPPVGYGTPTQVLAESTPRIPSSPIR